MALEPKTILAGDEPNPELADMQRRFWVSLVLTIPVLIAAMGEMIPGQPLRQLASQLTWTWVELILSSPVILWGGWPFFVRGSQSIVNRSLTCSLSLVAALAQVFPAAFRDHSGNVAVYSEAAAVIVTLVLLGQVLELRARSQTGAAITALLRPGAEDGTPGTRRRLETDFPLDQGAGWGAPPASAQEKKSRWTVWSWRERAA